MAATQSGQRIAGFWQRVGASFIDGFVVVPLTVPTSFIIGYGPASFAIAWILLTFPAAWAYTTIAHGRWGKTLGKHILEIRLVRADNGGRIGYAEAIRRDLAVIVFSLAGAILLVRVVLGGNTEGFRAFDQPAVRTYDENVSFGQIMKDAYSDAFAGYDPILLAVGALQWTWWLAEVTTMLTNGRRRALHDLIGGTVVVQTPAPQPVPPPVDLPGPERPQPGPTSRGF